MNSLNTLPPTSKTWDKSHLPRSLPNASCLGATQLTEVHMSDDNGQRVRVRQKKRKQRGLGQPARRDAMSRSNRASPRSAGGERIKAGAERASCGGCSEHSTMEKAPTREILAAPSERRASIASFTFRRRASPSLALHWRSATDGREPPFATDVVRFTDEGMDDRWQYGARCG